MIRKAFKQLDCVNAPSVVTLSGTVFGLMALFTSVSYRENPPMIIVFFLFMTYICDLSDGFVARRTGQTSEFGEMLDSLNDCFNFCILIPTLSYILISQKWWAIVSYALFMICGIIRLAYFNLNTTAETKGFFTGLSSPIACGIATLIGIYAVSGVIPFIKDYADYIMPIIFCVAGLAMVSSKLIKKYSIFGFVIGAGGLITYILHVIKFGFIGL